MTGPSKDSLPPLLPRQVHVWACTLEVDSSILEANWTLLSADERQRADRFARPELRRRFVVARANLRQLLGSYADRQPAELRFVYASAGKPELAGGGWHFNVSHSGERALIAVAMGEGGGAVGVDLERIHPLDYEAVARGVLGEPDFLALHQAPPSEKADLFFRLWVRHEARAKAIGAAIGTSADVPVFDLDVGVDYRAALATLIKDVRIEMLTR